MVLWCDNSDDSVPVSSVCLGHHPFALGGSRLHDQANLRRFVCLFLRDVSPLSTIYYRQIRPAPPPPPPPFSLSLSLSLLLLPTSPTPTLSRSLSLQRNERKRVKPFTHLYSFSAPKLYWVLSLCGKVQCNDTSTLSLRQAPHKQDTDRL